MASDLLTGRRLAGAQQHRQRPAGRDVVDMDGQKAAFVVMGIEQRQLLMAVHHVERVIDIERHCDRRRCVARAIKIDHHTHEPDDLAQVRGVLAAGHGRLRTQIQSAIRQSSAGQLEGGVKAQPIEIVGILVAAGDRQNASPQNLRQPVHKPQRITWISDHRRKLLGDREPPFGFARIITPPSEVIRPPSNAAVIFLLATAGKANGRNLSLVMAGAVRHDRVNRMALAPNSYARPIRYATPANIQIPSA
jgi:hypothetical protein